MYFSIRFMVANGVFCICPSSNEIFFNFLVPIFYGLKLQYYSYVIDIIMLYYKKKIEKKTCWNMEYTFNLLNKKVFVTLL